MTLLQSTKTYLRMMFKYEPKTFWNDLLGSSFDLKGVGHFRKSNEENEAMYRAKEEIVDGMLAKSGFNPRCSVLEVGCGVGYWTEYLRARGITLYTGNDIAPISVSNLSRKYPAYTFVLGDISEVEVATGPVDLVLCIDVTQHITDDAKFQAAVQRMWSSVSPGGHFLFTYWEPTTKKFLSHYLGLNRIEKARGLDAYLAVFGAASAVLETRPFNDKHIALVRKDRSAT